MIRFNIADWIIIAILVFSILVSLFRGLLREIISLSIWCIGFLLAIKFYDRFAVYFEDYISSPIARRIISFCLIFVVTMILGALLNKLLLLLMRKVSLGGVDRFLGVFFGFIRGVLVVAIGLLVVSISAFVDDNWWKESILIPNFDPLVKWLEKSIPEQIKNFAIDNKEEN